MSVKIKDKKISIWKQVKYNNKGQIIYKYERAIEGKAWAYYKQTGGAKTITSAGIAFINTVEDCFFYINYRKTDTSLFNLIVYNHKIYDVVYIDNNEGYTNDLKITCKLAENQDFSAYTDLVDD